MVRKSQAELNLSTRTCCKCRRLLLPSPSTRSGTHWSSGTVFYWDPKHLQSNLRRVACMTRERRRRHRWDENTALHFRGATGIFEIHILILINCINKQDQSGGLAGAWLHLTSKDCILATFAALLYSTKIICKEKKKEVQWQISVM